MHGCATLDSIGTPQVCSWAAVVHWAHLNTAANTHTHSDLASNNDPKAQSERGAALTQCLFQKATTLLAVHGRSKCGDTRRPISPMTAAAGPSMIMLRSAMRVMAFLHAGEGSGEGCR